MINYWEGRIGRKENDNDGINRQIDRVMQSNCPSKYKMEISHF